MYGVTRPLVSAGSSHDGAIETWIPQMSFPVAAQASLPPREAAAAIAAMLSASRRVKDVRQGTEQAVSFDAMIPPSSPSHDLDEDCRYRRSDMRSDQFFCM